MPVGDHARARALSRRGLLQAVPAASLLRAASAPTDLAAALCERWREVDEESRRLTLAWQDLETFLFSNHAWPRLTIEQQRAVPEAAPLYEIDAQLDLLHAERQDLLPRLMVTEALSRTGALEKLEVLASIVDPTDHPEAHALLRNVQRDILRLWV